MKPDDVYKWDAHSDQPHVIKDKRIKRALYRKGFWGTIKTFLTLFSMPIIGIKLLVTPRTRVGQKINMIGLCVNVDTPLPEKKPVSDLELRDMVTELQVQNIQIRIPLSDIESLQVYIDLIKTFEDRSILVNILQDRRHIDDPVLLQQSLDEIFKALHGRVTHVQVGNAVNRRKWAFISLDEYFRFFGVAQQLRDQKYPNLKLLGSGIIDFELPNFARSVFHGYPIKYDAAAALLYVDRRGAPENTQIFCDLITKINWFYEMARYSTKCATQLWITETNWPLIDTEPFAPASGNCLVNEQLQAAYLVRYFLLAIASGNVEKCFWHQLIAPGYGLVDNRGDELRKRAAYYSYKTLIRLVDGGVVLTFTRNADGVYRLMLRNSRGLVEACWVDAGEGAVPISLDQHAIDHMGMPVSNSDGDSLRVTQEVVYLLDHAFVCDRHEH